MAGLTAVAVTEGENQGYYAERLDVEPITLCRMVDRMEEAGLLERRRDPADRRAWQVHLTERSRPMIERLREKLSNESVADRIARMVAQLERAAGEADAGPASHPDAATVRQVRNINAQNMQEARDYADAGDARTLRQAKSYADQGDAATLERATAYAEAYADRGDARTLERRAQAMEAWLADPKLMEADKDAEYAEIIEIDLAEINEPVLCAPNDPDDARLLSSVQGEKIDEVFIGSCMTNIGHFRAAGKLLEKVEGTLPTRLWLSPPTKMDQHQLTEEGYYGIYGKAGARMEMPGCSLCMGNQARVEANSTVVSTSTRNFPNRLGDGANVYLASAELAAVASILGRLPTVEEYMVYAKEIDTMAADVYRYLSFDQIAEFREAAANAQIPVVQA